MAKQKKYKRMTKPQIKKVRTKFLDFLSKNPSEGFNSADLGAMVGISTISTGKILTTMVNDKEIWRKGKKGKYLYYVRPSASTQEEHEKGVFVVIHHGQSSPVFNDIALACADAKLKATEADTDVVYVAQLRKSFQQVVAEEDIV